LKRTRRVEIVRYSRRTTVIREDAAASPDPAEAQAAIEVLLGLAPSLPEASLVATDVHDGQVAAADESGTQAMPKRRLWCALKQLLGR